MRKKLIAQVHIAKKELGLDEEVYRAVLASATDGKTSCGDMDVADLNKVIQHMKDRDWKPRRSSSKGGRYSPKTRDKKFADQVDVIRAIWIEMHKQGITQDGSEDALDKWVQRTTSYMNGGIGLSRVEWLRGDRWHTLATKVLESLKLWQKRIHKEWMNEDLRKITLEQRRTDQPEATVIQQLLDANEIHWWNLFSALNIEQKKSYRSLRGHYG